MQKLNGLILVGLLAMPVFANDWYGGIGVVKSSLDEKVVLNNTTLNVEYDKTNIKVFTGIKLSDNLAGEFHYTNFAKEDITNITINNVAVPIAIEGNSFGGALLYSFTPQSAISAFAKIGLHAYDVEISAGNAKVSDDDTDLFYGVGVDIKMTDTLVARFDFERLDLDDTEVDNFGANIVFIF